MLILLSIALLILAVPAFEFKIVSNNFQRQLTDDMKVIRSSNKF